jgi:hypothetical protein
VTLRRSIVAAVVVLATPALVSCGFDAPTDQVYTPAVGVNDRSGTVDVLNAMVVSGDDGSGTLVAALVNNDQADDDALTGVGGAGQDQAANVTLPGGQVDVPAGGLVQLADEGNVTVEAERVTPGNFVELQFTFERGETITVKAPVVANEGDYADVQVP